ncbi:glycosyltransferase [Pedobacter chinensis]|uniref:Glycosyltransferase n=1 Tax=Pedobacter chinensis TaxID=2282421 RepID=A0A369PUA3_9SPHI|nr:glycosyltransferase family 4 protein [Pedobacter chinensis]RDC54299.1 glycosyltransferase [Pedobacter chinensis]
MDIKDGKIKIAYLSQVPAPYRERMHELIHQDHQFSYDVIYCAKLEPNRKWELEYGNYKMHFLTDVAKTFRHNNTNVWALLKKLNPNVLIITAFKPTMLYGVIWCLLNGRKIIVYNDGTFNSEKSISMIQKQIRKFVYWVASSFMAPSKGTNDLYNSYGVGNDKIFRSCLCVDNSVFDNLPVRDREFTIMFSGQIIERKLPLFFANIAIELSKKIPGFKALIIGDGEQREEMIERLKQNNVDFEFTGFLDQKILPKYYSRAKLFLFTTKHDEWGIVANEACASGTPVITSVDAGAANDLIIHNINGYILPINVNIWVEHILKLLGNDNLYNEFSINALAMVAAYNHQQAAGGLVDAVNYALAEKNKSTQSNTITA